MGILILWVYIGLLLAGGLIGYFKAGSRVSLIMSAIFALALATCALGWWSWPYLPDVLLVLLLIVFGMRLGKTRKFMPSGLMLAVTLLALLLRHVV